MSAERPRVDSQSGIPRRVAVESMVAPAAHDVYTRSPAMRRVFDMAARVAPVDSTVLITGESGVGKERLARWVHQHSQRCRGPFVGVNCAAIPESLLETELFGHARGAFTGAGRDHVGLVEAAHGGTLFLDEIGDVSEAMQRRLLRVLQEREVRRVGETFDRHVDFRLVAATNRHLRTEIARERFREDLYYRLSVITLDVPPLRDRPEDLPRLAHEALTRAAARVRRPIAGFTRRALEQLRQYRWPGNVRQLEHALESACAVATGPRIDLEDLPEEVRERAPDESLPAVKSLQELELEHMITTLRRTGGNRRRAAAQLGISVATLRRRLRAAGYARLTHAELGR
jgi:transcriptional regulator with PAS, ATPase and Fis domain